MTLDQEPELEGQRRPVPRHAHLRTVSDEDQRIDTFTTGQADGFYTSTPASVTRAQDAVDDVDYAGVAITDGSDVHLQPDQAAVQRRPHAQGLRDGHRLAGDGRDGLRRGCGSSVQLLARGFAVLHRGRGVAGVRPCRRAEADRRVRGRRTAASPSRSTTSAFQQTLDQARGEVHPDVAQPAQEHQGRGAGRRQPDRTSARCSRATSW